MHKEIRLRGLISRSEENIRLDRSLIVRYESTLTAMALFNSQFSRIIIWGSH